MKIKLNRKKYFTGKKKLKNVKMFEEFVNEAESPKKYKMSKTYEVWDEESVEHGETNDKGFEYEDQEFDSLWEIAKEIRDNGATEPSESGGSAPHKTTWYSTPDADQNIKSGEKTFYSFHPKLNTDAEAKELGKLIKMERAQFNAADPDLED